MHFPQKSHECADLGSTAHDLGSLFLQRCQHTPDDLAYVFIREDQSLDELTFGTLGTRVLKLAGGLAARATPRARVLLAFNNCQDAIELFWACIIAGVIPVPAPAPDTRQSKVNLPRLRSIAGQAGTSLVITAVDQLTEEIIGDSLLTWITPDSLQTQPMEDHRFNAPSAGDVAYLQYTSGSTADPRGAMLSHTNVIAQCRAVDPVTRTVSPEFDRCSLSWLPWYHDYGLIQGVILPVYEGQPSYLMPTLSFLRHPLRWLELISKFRITHSGAPDFAYAACAAAASRQPNWTADLRSWQLASCGAEPIRPATIEAFCKTFEPFGFGASAFSPAYGLAEAVLAVSIHAPVSPPVVRTFDAHALEQHLVRPPTKSAETRRLVGCGKPLQGFDVQIVDPQLLRPCAPDTIGEIWIAGPSVSQGYWNQPEENAKTFGLSLGDDMTGFLRTGDMGFLQDGELFIAGRRKDMLIVHGRNIYPQDIEDTAQTAHPVVRQGGVMAIGIEHNGREALVLLVECVRRPDPDEVRTMIDSVRRTVALTHEIDVLDILPLRSGSLPRTSSGKRQRSKGKDLYLQNALEKSTLSAAPDKVTGRHVDSIDSRIADIWTEVVGTAPVGRGADFFQLGGDSLLATQIVSRINQTFGLRLPIRAVYEAPSVGALATLVRAGKLRNRPENPGPGISFSSVRRLPSALSFSQERMWFMQALAPASSAYNISAALQISGPLDMPALESALDSIIRRHEVLRTTYLKTELTVLPVVHDSAPLLLSQHRIGSPNDLGRAEATEQLIGKLCRVPYDLERDLPLRVHLLERGPNDSVLLLVIHHIASDQWSLAIFGRELSRFYNDAVRQLPPQVPDLPLQYGQYATWHRQWFEAQGERELAYWQKQLAGLEPTELHADRPRPAQQGWSGATLRVDLPPALTASLTALGGRHGASLSMVMMAALNVILHRHTGQHDIAIGVPIANRHHLMSEPLIGTFVNTLVLRTNLSGDLDFSGVVDRVREVALEAYAHQDMPFEQLVQGMNVRRDTSRSPLFQVMFNMVNTPIGAIEFESLDWSLLDFDRGSAQFDLSVSIDAVLNHNISFEYSTDIFDRTTIERFAQQYRRVLDVAGSTPTLPISAIDLLGRQDLALMRSWENGPATVPRWPSVTAQLDDAFEQFRASTAAEFGNSTISYAQLQDQSARICEKLLRNGVARTEMVGLLLPRSIEMIAGLIGIMKAGAAYVPMDPGYPQERLGFMIEDTRLRWLVTTPELADLIGWPRDRCIWATPDQDVQSASAATTAPPPPRVDPEDPAYVIFTSGSTGRPKGVVVPHRAVVNFLASMAVEPGMRASDRLLAVTTLSFDIAVLELLLPLTTGATIVLASDAEASDGQSLLRLIEHRHVTLMQATPSRWHMMLESGWARPVRLKALVGGEPLQPRMAAKLGQLCTEVWNMYGPTETTVWSTCGRVTGRADNLISLGRPIANTQVYVLDQNRQRQPIGVPGEICIGGEGVTIGYLDRPELTAERFVTGPDHRTLDRPRGIYRTGDLGRWRHDGSLEHLGRLDMQVKIRGFRIELGEIEAQLLSHPSIERALVIAAEEQPGNARLVGYIVGREGHQISSAEVTAHLRQWLPEHMATLQLIEVPAIPLLANGKVDRRNLPKVSDHGSSAPPTSPRTSMEEIVWNIWREVLGTERFGVHDNFFELGGHSLIAVSVAARIRQELQVDCELSLIFQHPTIAGLCTAMEQRDRSPGLAVIPLQPSGQGAPLFCICGINLYQELADHLGPEVPVSGVFVRTELAYLDGEPDSGQPSVAYLASLYIQAIREHQPSGPYRLLGISFGGLLAYEMAQQLQRAGDTVSFLAVLDFRLSATGLRGLVQRGRAIVGRALRRIKSHRGTQPAGQETPSSRQAALRLEYYQRAVQGYSPAPYTGEMILVQATDAPRHDPDYGWDRLVENLHTYQIFDSHLGILAHSSSEKLAGMLRPHLLHPISAAHPPAGS